MTHFIIVKVIALFHQSKSHIDFSIAWMFRFCSLNQKVLEIPASSGHGDTIFWYCRITMYRLSPSIIDMHFVLINRSISVKTFIDWFINKLAIFEQRNRFESKQHRRWKSWSYCKMCSKNCAYNNIMDLSVFDFNRHFVSWECNFSIWHFYVKWFFLGV